MKIERVYLVAGMLWLLCGMGLGHHMGMTQDHGQLPTHTHIMLAGGILSILWAIINRVWGIGSGIMAWIQFLLHQAGAGVMVFALFQLYGGNPTPQAGILAGIGGTIIMVATVLKLVLTFRGKAAP
ncbi:MAG: hypothetical protein DHS20C06_19520 [Hyphobacterium sp.]|nr:MAG: hypothetical protein DHS20C06_19520 [Hyphobacterium sp.]